MSPRIVDVREDVLKTNDHLAQGRLARFTSAGTVVVSLALGIDGKHALGIAAIAE